MNTSATDPTDTATARLSMSTAQWAVFRAILEWIADTGRTPTVRNIQAVCGFASPNSVTGHVMALARLGKIVLPLDGTARGIEVPAIRDAAKLAAKNLLGETK